MLKLLKWFKRKPDMNIGPDYMHRWYIIPRNRLFNIYLHKILRDDDDRALHDHPWWSLSILLKGKLLEIMQGPCYYCTSFEYCQDCVHSTLERHPKRFIPLIRSATLAHRLEVVEGPVWTLFITGPRVREWGFLCPKGWVHWRIFTNPDDTGKTGKGCGD